MEDDQGEQRIYADMSVWAMKNKFIRTESKISRDIRIISEVEKIWIKYDLDNSCELDYIELA